MIHTIRGYMKNIFTQQLQIADEMKNDSEKLNYLTAIIRSILQLAVTTSLEVFLHPVIARIQPYLN